MKPYKCSVCGGTDHYYYKPKNLKYPSSHCRSCAYKRTVTYRSKHRKMYALYASNSSKRRRKQIRLREKAYYADPLGRKKILARQAVYKAVKAGHLKRGPCYRCGSLKNVHGHHMNYERPLHVRWVCSLCHGVLHSRVLA